MGRRIPLHGSTRSNPLPGLQRSLQVHLGLWKGCFLAVQDLGILAIFPPWLPFSTSRPLRLKHLGPSLRPGGGHLNGQPGPGRIEGPTQLFFRQAFGKGCFQEVDSSAPACLRLCLLRFRWFPQHPGTWYDMASCVPGKLQVLCFCGSGHTHSIPDPCWCRPFRCCFSEFFIPLSSCSSTV